MSRGPPLLRRTRHMRSDPCSRSSQMDMRHRALQRHYRGRPRHSHSPSKQWSPLTSMCLLHRRCTLSTRPHRRPQCPEDTQYTSSRLMHSRGRQDTAYSQWTDQSPGLLDLPHSRRMPWTLGRSACPRGKRSHRRHMVSLGLRQCPDIQMGSACIRLPQGVRNIPHRTASMVWTRPHRGLLSPRHTDDRTPAQSSCRCRCRTLHTECLGRSQCPPVHWHIRHMS